MRKVLGTVLAITLACAITRGALADAPADWRAAAEARIEQIRKADLAVTVVDSNGKPVPNADVTVRMTRHAFPFGTCVNAGLIARETDLAKQYRERIPKLFNIAVTENDLKWPTWEGAYPDFNHADSLAGLHWLRERGIAIRGHNLVWPSWQWTPKDLKTLKNNPEALRKRVRDHIVSILGDTRGLCDEWDVVNEPFSHHDVIDVLGREEMVEWYKLARANTPEGCKLYINDFDNLEGGLNGANEPHRRHYEDTIQFLIDHGAPLDGVGLQCHFGGKRSLTPPEQLMPLLDRFARFGKELKITEFDVDTNGDEQRQADYTRDFYTVAFSHPKVTGILMWGFWEAHHWKPQCALFRRDWSIKPNGQAYLDLVFGKWWTNVTGKSDANGVFKTRGFLGDYEITSGKAKTHCTLIAGGTDARVIVETK